MNWAYVHIAVNHVPVILVPVALALLVFAIVCKSAELTNVGLGLIVITAVVGGAVFFTGEPAEKMVEHLPGISRDTIKEHENAAGVASAVTGLAGVLALGAFAAGRGGRQAPPWLLAATCICALVAAGLMARAANLGGHIRHPEIAAAATTSEAVRRDRLG